MFFPVRRDMKMYQSNKIIIIIIFTLLLYLVSGDIMASNDLKIEYLGGNKIFSFYYDLKKLKGTKNFISSFNINALKITNISKDTIELSELTFVFKGKTKTFQINYMNSDSIKAEIYHSTKFFKKSLILKV